VIQFRKPHEQDIPIISEWIEADPEHSSKGMRPDFFFTNQAVSIAVLENGDPGLFMRIDPEAPTSVRVHMQFSPNSRLTAKVMLKGWPTVSQKIWQSGISRIVFESKSEPLIFFCQRAFGFKNILGSDEYELVRVN
jgi:hypothetical protein